MSIKNPNESPNDSAMAEVCKHPPTRLYAWSATDEHGDHVLCVACCACGAVLKGGVE